MYASRGSTFRSWTKEKRPAYIGKERPRGASSILKMKSEFSWAWTEEVIDTSLTKLPQWIIKLQHIPVMKETADDITYYPCVSVRLLHAWDSLTNPNRDLSKSNCYNSSSSIRWSKLCHMVNFINLKRGSTANAIKKCQRELHITVEFAPSHVNDIIWFCQTLTTLN